MSMHMRLLVLLCLVTAPMWAVAVDPAVAQAEGFWRGVYELVKGPVTWLVMALAIVASVYGFMQGNIKWAFYGIGGMVFIGMGISIIDAATPSTYTGGAGSITMAFPYFGDAVNSTTDTWKDSRDWYLAIQSFAWVGARLCENFLNAGIRSGLIPMIMVIGCIWSYYRFSVNGDIKSVFIYCITLILVWSFCIVPTVRFMPAANPNAPATSVVDQVLTAGGVPTAVNQPSVPLLPAMAFVGAYEASNLIIGSLNLADSSATALLAKAAASATPSQEVRTEFDAYSRSLQSAMKGSMLADASFGRARSDPTDLAAPGHFKTLARYHAAFRQPLSELSETASGDNYAVPAGRRMKWAIGLPVPNGSYLAAGEKAVELKSKDLRSLARHIATSSDVGAKSISFTNSVNNVASLVHGNIAAFAPVPPLYGNNVRVVTPYDSNMYDHVSSQSLTSGLNADSNWYMDFFYGKSYSSKYPHVPGEKEWTNENGPSATWRKWIINASDPTVNERSGPSLAGKAPLLIVPVFGLPTAAGISDTHKMIAAPYDGAAPHAPSSRNPWGLKVQFVQGTGQDLTKLGTSTFNPELVIYEGYMSGIQKTGAQKTDPSKSIPTTFDASAQKDSIIYVDYTSYIRAVTAASLAPTREHCLKAANEKDSTSGLWGCIVVGAYLNGSDIYNQTPAVVKDAQLVFENNVRDQVDTLTQGGNTMHAALRNAASDQASFWAATVFDLYTSASGIAGPQGLGVLPPKDPTTGAKVIGSDLEDDPSFWDMFMSLADVGVGIIIYIFKAILNIMLFFVNYVFKYVIGAIIMLMFIVYPFFAGAALLPGRAMVPVSFAQAAFWIGLWPVPMALGAYFMNAGAASLLNEATGGAGSSFTTAQVIQFMGAVMILMAPAIVSAAMSLSSQGLQQMGTTMLGIGMQTMGAAMTMISAAVGAIGGMAAGALAAKVAGATASAAVDGGKAASAAVGKGIAGTAGEVAKGVEKTAEATSRGVAGTLARGQLIAEAVTKPVAATLQGVDAIAGAAGARTNLGGAAASTLNDTAVGGFGKAQTMTGHGATWHLGGTAKDAVENVMGDPKHDTSRRRNAEARTTQADKAGANHEIRASMATDPTTRAAALAQADAARGAAIESAGDAGNRARRQGLFHDAADSHTRAATQAHTLHSRGQFDFDDVMQLNKRADDSARQSQQLARQTGDVEQQHKANTLISNLAKQRVDAASSESASALSKADAIANAKLASMGYGNDYAYSGGNMQVIGGAALVRKEQIAKKQAELAGHYAEAEQLNAEVKKLKAKEAAGIPLTADDKTNMANMQERVAAIYENVAEPAEELRRLMTSHDRDAHSIGDIIRNDSGFANERNRAIKFSGQASDARRDYDRGVRVAAEHAAVTLAQLDYADAGSYAKAKDMLGGLAMTMAGDDPSAKTAREHTMQQLKAHGVFAKMAAGDTDTVKHGTAATIMAKGVLGEVMSESERTDYGTMPLQASVGELAKMSDHGQVGSFVRSDVTSMQSRANVLGSPAIYDDSNHAWTPQAKLMEVAGIDGFGVGVVAQKVETQTADVSFHKAPKPAGVDVSFDKEPARKPEGAGVA